MRSFYAVAITTAAGRRRYLGRARFGSGRAWRRNRARATLFPDPTTARRAGRAEAANAALAKAVTIHRVDMMREGTRWHAESHVGTRASGEPVALGLETAMLARVRPNHRPTES